MIEAFPAAVNPATMSDLDFRTWLTAQATAAEAIYAPGESRPTFDFGFEPTLADDAEAASLLDPDDDDHADDLARHFDESARMEAAFGDPWDSISPEERMECGGHYPSDGYDY